MEVWDASHVVALDLCPDLQLHKKFQFNFRTKPKSDGTTHFKKVQQPGPGLGFHKRQFHGLAQNLVSAKFWTSGPDSQKHNLQPGPAQYPEPANTGLNNAQTCLLNLNGWVPLLQLD